MLSSLTLFALFIFILSLLAIYRFYHARKQAKERSLRGITAVTRLIDIIKLTQEHRALYVEHLKGQDLAKNQLEAIEKQINQRYLVLIGKGKDLDKTLKRFAQKSQRIWGNILQNPSRDINKSFHTHSSLIQRLLDCLWDIADDYSLTTHTDHNIQSLANDLVRTLPKLTEAIGQVRAIALQITHSKYCSSDKKLLLLFTLSKIQRDLSQVQPKLQKQHYNKLTSFIEEITKSVEDQALSDRNPDTFFNEAGSHIDIIFNNIQTGLNELKTQVILQPKQRKRAQPST